jgi:quinol monooxygenase YgiN
MKHVMMVRYKVKPDQAARNEELVRAVYDELHRTEPAGLRYATFRMQDGVTFVHLAEHADASNPLTELAAFAKFQEGIRDRCDEPPVATELHEIGSFRR